MDCIVVGLVYNILHGYSHLLSKYIPSIHVLLSCSSITKAGWPSAYNYISYNYGDLISLYEFSILLIFIFIIKPFAI